MATRPKTLRIYVAPDGKKPFAAWLDSLKDRDAQGRILARLERVRLGLLGDCKSVGEGVSELRIDTGPGYRVYFRQHGQIIIVLLGGGHKATQKRDIAAAKALWNDYRSRNNEQDDTD